MNFKRTITLLFIALFYCACGVKGDPITPPDSVIAPFPESDFKQKKTKKAEEERRKRQEQNEK